MIKVAFFTLRIFVLHIVAALSVAAGAWDIWRATTIPGHQTLYLPVIVLWFVYYAVCLRRA